MGLIQRYWDATGHWLSDSPLHIPFSPIWTSLLQSPSSITESIPYQIKILFGYSVKLCYFPLELLGKEWWYFSVTTLERPLSIRGATSSFTHENNGFQSFYPLKLPASVLQNLNVLLVVHFLGCSISSCEALARSTGLLCCSLWTARTLQNAPNTSYTYKMKVRWAEVGRQVFMVQPA